MRVIDADYVLSALSGLNDRENGDEHFLNGIETAVEVIENAPTVGGWISVEDRLPMLIESVLFTGKNAHGGPFLTQRGYFDGTFWHSDSIGTVYAITPVTHWMPLPEPPEVY